MNADSYMTPQGLFVLMDESDPLRGELRRTETMLLERSRGQVLLLVDQGLRPLAEAWTEVYRALGARDTRVILLARREDANEPQVAERVAASPLVVLAAQTASAYLRLMAGTRLVEALVATVLQGGAVVGMGPVSSLFGMAALVEHEGKTYSRSGLGILPGIAVVPRVEGAGRFNFLAHLISANPDLLGLGLASSSSVVVAYRGRAVVVEGEVTLLDASSAEIATGAARNLRTDLLTEGESFEIPVF